MPYISDMEWNVTRLALPSLCILVLFALTEFPDCSAAVAGQETLVMAWESAPRSIDPRYAVDIASRDLESLVQCSLISFDATGKTVGDLAEKWIWSDDRTLKITIRSHATFSDGTPVTSADVKATFDSFKRKDVVAASPLAKNFASIQDILSPDAVTVLFKLSEPDAAFLSHLEVGILPTKLTRTPMLEAEKPHTGCGPFMLSSYDTTGLVLLRNPNYSLGPRPKLERIEIKVVKDEAARLAKLRRGEIDLAHNLLNYKKVAEIAKGAPHLQVLRRTGLNTDYVGFNVKDSILKSVAVRRAISMAINRGAIIKHLYNGFALTASTLLPPTDAFYDTTLEPSHFDPVAAAKLLDESGFKDPGSGSQPRFTVTYKTTTNASRFQVAKAVAAMLAKVGIKVTVQAMAWEKLYEDMGKGNVQLWGLSLDEIKDPDVYREAFGSESFPPRGRNYGGYTSADLDRLLTSGKGEVKEASRRQIYNKVQRLIEADVPYAFLWHEEVIAIANESVRGFELYGDGRLTSLKVAWKE